MTEQQPSYRALGERTRRADPAGDGLTHGHLANLVEQPHPTQPPRA
jgi:hypothetical protein